MFDDDTAKYAKLLDRVAQSDFFHETEYLLLEANRLGGKFVYYYDEINGSNILIPFICRAFEYSKVRYQDLTSPYGYSSPLFTGKSIYECVEEFSRKFHNCLNVNNIVSVFMRQSPLISEESYSLFEKNVYGKIRLIELSRNHDLLFEEYRKVHRRDIRKVESLGIEIFDSPMTSNHVEEFINIYFDTMSRVGASNSYFFDQQYISQLIKNFGTNIRYVKAIIGNETIACSIFILHSPFVHYYLSGTSENEFRGFGMKAILDHMIKWSSDNSYLVMNLGGGLGGQEDSLYHFKKGFGGFDKDVSVTKIIANKSIYADLASAKPEVTFPGYSVDYI